MMDEVQEYLQFVKSRPPLDDLYAALAGLAEGYGFQYLAYTVIRAPKAHDMTGFVVKYDQGATTRTNYSQDWIAHYEAECYLWDDPVFDMTSKVNLPFRWSDLEQSEGLTKHQRKLFAEASEAGMRNGMTVPLHGPVEGLAALNLCGDISDRELDLRWPDYRVNLFTAAAFTHEIVMSEATVPNALASVHLGPREHECLAWTARGKTTWEIAQILDIREDTARYYLRQAADKLGVHSKHHAVVKAIAAGLIEP